MAKTLHYNFLTDPTLTGSEHPIATSPDLSITRATSATMVDADGYIREVQAGEARFTGATFRNNLYKNSNNIGGTSWVNNNITVTTGATTTPDGNNATLIKNNNSGSASYYSRQDISGRVAGERYIVSFVVKSVAGSGWCWIIDEGLNYIFFDLINGVVGTTEAEWSNAAITDLGGGWYRISAVRTYTGVSSALTGIGITDADGNKTFTPTGSDEQQIYAGEAQWEEASGVARTTPSAFIATGTTTQASSLTGTSTKGLLVEEARSNICLQSEDFSTTWANGGLSGTINTNVTTAPDGSSTADRLIDSGETGFGLVGVLQDITGISTSTMYTVSCFAKQDQEDFFGFELDLFTTPVDNTRAYFDLANGTVGTVDAGFDGGAGIEDYGNGWYRCHASFTTDGTDSVGRVWVRVHEADNTPNCIRDGTVSIFVWGAQVEAGAFPTSYIPTTTASVTRNADNVSTTDVSWFAAGADGTLYSRAQQQFLNSADDSFIVALTDATTLRVSQYIQDAPAENGRTLVTGFASGLNNAYPADTEVRQAAAYAAGDLQAYFNGVAGNASSHTLSSTVGTDRIWVGAQPASGGTSHLNGHIAEIAYFNERLANATLEDYSLNGLPTAFPGTVAGDGGHIWPARSNDPRWAQIITDSGITPSGNFIDDVHAALEAMASTTGAMDDLWKKVKAVYSITDTSEPFTY